MLKLILFVLPLSLDTFAVSAALGTRAVGRRERLRTSLILAGFETAMPIVGLFLGRGLGSAIGTVADAVAIALLAAVGLWMLAADGEDEAGQVGQLPSRHGLALLALGVGISLDELAIGFTIGLLGLSIWLAVVLIGVQAFGAAQLGLRLGARLSERFRERVEKLAGAGLIGIAVLLIVEKLT